MLYRLFIFLFITVNSYAGDTFIYVASSDPAALVTFKVTDQKLVKVNSLPLEATPDTMTFSKDRKFLYLSSNIKKPQKTKKKKGATSPAPAKQTYTANAKSVIFSLAISTTGIPEIKNRIVSEIQPRFMVSGKNDEFLLVTDYFAGKSATMELQDKLLTGKVISIAETERLSHSIAISKNNKFAYAPHTGPNKVYQFTLDDKGILKNHSSSPGPEKSDKRYHAPRHCDWHPTLPILYTSNEHAGGISAWKMDVNTGALKLFQTLSSLPADFKGNSTAADIHITPDGHFAYVSNRGKSDASSKAGVNTIACFSIDPTSGIMSTVGHYKSATRPRSFCISPNGKMLVSLGQADKKIVLHELNPDNGALTIIDSQTIAGKPNWGLSLER